MHDRFGKKKVRLVTRIDWQIEAEVSIPRLCNDIPFLATIVGFDLIHLKTGFLVDFVDFKLWTEPSIVPMWIQFQIFF